MSEEEPQIVDKLYATAWRALEEHEEIKVIYCLEEDSFYQYKNGTWKKVFEAELLALLCDKIDFLKKIAISTRRKVIENMKTIRYMHIHDFNQSEFLNFPNTMINPNSGDIAEHQPNYYSTLQIPYEFNENSICELWEKTLKEIFEDDQEKITMLQEYMGYCLTRDVRQEKGMLLLGDSRSGKSTIINTIRYMIGFENCSYVAIKHLNNPQYTGMMATKLINIDTDVSAKAIEYEDEYKKVVTGEPIKSNAKYENPYDFNPFCKMVMSANDFPRITDHSSAFFKRLILIPCDRVFEEQEQNKDLRKQLLEELPGILNWTIQGLKRLNERGRFEEKEFMREAIEELREESNAIEGFFKEHIQISYGQEIEKGELFDKYKSWADKNNQYKLSKVIFGSSFFRKYSKFTPKNTASHITHKRVWKNIQYVEFKTEETIASESKWHEPKLYPEEEI